MSFEVYRRLTIKGWRFFWRLRAKNGRIIAVGGESFHNQGDVFAIIDRMIKGMDVADIKEI